MTGDPDAVLDELFRELVNQVHEFSEFKYLFFGPDIRTELLARTATHFFGELFHSTLERIVLGVAKLTDSASSGANKRFSLAYVHQVLAADPRYPGDAAARMLEAADRARRHVKQWRHTILAHKDRDTALGERDAGEVVPSEIGQFYDAMQGYIENVSQALGKGPKPLDTVAYFGTLELVRALVHGAVFDELLDRDPLKYDEVLTQSNFYGAQE